MTYTNPPSKDTWIYSDDLRVHVFTDKIRTHPHGVQINKLLDTLKDCVTHVDTNTTSHTNTYHLRDVEVRYWNKNCTNGHWNTTPLLSVERKDSWVYLYSFDFKNETITKTDRLYCTDNIEFLVDVNGERKIVTAAELFRFDYDKVPYRLKVVDPDNGKIQDMPQPGGVGCSSLDYAIEITKLVFDQQGGLTDESCSVVTMHRQNYDRISIMDLDTILDYNLSIDSKLHSSRNVSVAYLYRNNNYKDKVVRFTVRANEDIWSYEQITNIQIKPASEIIPYVYRLNTEAGSYMLSCTDQFSFPCI